MEGQKITEVFTDLENVKPVTSTGIDLNEFDKKETTIENVSVIKVRSDYTDVKTQWVLKVESIPLATVKDDTNDKEIVFRCSELFNLYQSREGDLMGFPTMENSNLMKFVKDLGVKDIGSLKSLKDLVEQIKGKKALIKAYEKDKQGVKRVYLSFRY